MEELDALLDAAYARAAELQRAQDPEAELRQLLAPVRELFAQRLRRESAGSSSSSGGGSSSSLPSEPAPTRPLGYMGKLQALVARSPPAVRRSTLLSSGKKSVQQDVKPQTYLNGAATRLHALVTGSKTLSANSLRGKQQQSEAAVRIQALVRGKTQRQTLTRQHSIMVQGTKVRRRGS